MRHCFLHRIVNFKIYHINRRQVKAISNICFEKTFMRATEEQEKIRSLFSFPL